MLMKNISGRSSNDFLFTDKDSQLNVGYLPANGPCSILADVANTFLTAL